MVETINKFKKVARRLGQLFDRRPTEEELAEVMEFLRRRSKRS